MAFNGAEPIRAETLEQFSQKFAQCGFNYSAFYPCYGMAETTLFMTGGEKNQRPVIQRVKAGELEENSVVETEISSKESRDSRPDTAELTTFALTTNSVNRKTRQVIVCSTQQIITTVLKSQIGLFQG